MQNLFQMLLSYRDVKYTITGKGVKITGLKVKAHLSQSFHPIKYTSIVFIRFIK